MHPFLLSSSLKCGVAQAKIDLPVRVRSFFLYISCHLIFSILIDFIVSINTEYCVNSIIVTTILSRQWCNRVNAGHVTIYTHVRSPNFEFPTRQKKNFLFRIRDCGHSTGAVYVAVQVPKMNDKNHSLSFGRK